MNSPKLFGRVALLCLLAGVGRGATVTWDANTSSNGAQDGAGVWDTGSMNWVNISTNVLWNNGSPDSAIFGGGINGSGTGGVVTIAVPITISNLTFNLLPTNTSLVVPYTISGGPLTLAGQQVITMNAGATIDAILAGGGFTKSGGSTLTLGGVNTFTGNVVVSQGILTLTNGNALGASPLVTVSGNQKLRLSGGITVTGTTVSINGTGGGDAAGALQSGAFSTNTWAGRVVMAADQSRIGADAGATMIVSGVIEHNGTTNGVAFRNTDMAGWVVVSGANTYSGKTTVVLGRVQMAGGDNRFPVASLLEIGNPTGVSNALLDLTGFNQQFSGITDPGNMAKVITNSALSLSTLTIGGDNSYSATSGLLIMGNIALVKNGTGTQVIAKGASAYAGGTTINGGTLALGGDGNGTENQRGLGNGPVTINAGGQLRFGGAVAGTVYSITNNVVLEGGTIWAQDGQQHFTNALGTFTVGAAGGTLITVNGNKDLWIESQLVGPGALTVDNSATSTGGTATVRFGGLSNTYSGTITVNGPGAGFQGGRISFQRDSALANATLVMNGTNGMGFASSAPVLGALAGSGGIGITNGIVLSVGNNGSNTSYGGVLSGAGQFVKIGAGALSLSGVNTLTNVTTINGGTLSLAASGSVSNSPVVTGAAGTFDVSAIAPYVVPVGSPISGGGIVSGTVVAVDASRVIPGGNGTPGTLTIAGSLTMNGGFTNSFDLTNSVTMGGGVNDLLIVEGGLEPSGAMVRINPLSPLDNGSYRLVNYGGAKTTSFNTNAVGNATHKTWTVDEGTTGQVNLVISGTFGNLRWNSVDSTNWNQTDTNWFDVVTAATNNFLTYDNVLFDDNGASVPGINLATTVQPSAVVVNSTSNYSVTGGGKITGTTGITKLGPGTLAFGGVSNDFIGPVIVSNGIFRLMTATALGSPAVGTTVNGGTLDIGGITNVAGDVVTISGNGFANTGAVINSGAFNDKAIRSLVLSSDAKIAAWGSGWYVAGTTTVDLAGYTLAKVGTGAVYIVGMTTTNAGNMAVASGILGFARGQTAGSGVIGAAPGSVVELANYTSGSFNKDVALTSATLRVVGNSMTVTSRIVVVGTATNDVAATLSFALVSPITGPGVFVKSGGGRTVFATTNAFAGPLIIANSGGGVNLNSAVGPSVPGAVILGNLADGGGAAFLTASNSGQFAAGATIHFAGSPGDFSWLKLFGTTQTVDSITSDDNGGGNIDNVQDASILSDGVLIIAGAGNSIFSGSYMRDSGVVLASPPKLRVIQNGSGTLTLAGAGTNMTFSGGVVVNSGTLNLKADGAAGVAPIVMAGGVLSLDGAGLLEGVLVGSSTNITQPNPGNSGTKLSTKRANLTTDFATTTTWGYTGYLVVTNPSGVIYTFAENFDDQVNLKIDGATVINDAVFNVPSLATVTLAPGLHRFDLRLFNNTVSAGPVLTSWWTNSALGVGYDPLGRGQTNSANYQLIADAGDGLIFCTDVTVTNAVSLLSNVQIKVSNAIGPTNSLTGPITDGGSNLSVTKTGAGILRLAGQNTYGGATLVSSGMLLVDGTQFGNGAMTVLSNAAIWGTGVVASAAITIEAGASIGPRFGANGGTFTVSNLTIAGGTIFHALLNGTNATLHVTGDLTTASNITIRFQPLEPIALGTSSLVNYDGVFAGDISHFTIASLPNGSQGYLTNDLVNTSLDLVITNIGAGLKWDGGVNGAWDIAGTANWKSILAGTTTPFTSGDAVSFDDTAAGNFAINLLSSVTVASFAISNETQNYSFSGASIGGGFGITKLGAAKLSLFNANTFTGATRVSAGTLAIVSDASLGTPPSVATPGHLTLNGGTTLKLTTNITLSSNRRVAVGPSSGSGIVTLSVATGSTMTTSSTIVNTPGGTGALVKAGSGSLFLNNINTYSGGTVINGGLVQINVGGDSASAIPPGTPLTVQNGSTLRLVGGTALGQGSGNPSVVTVNLARVTAVAGNSHQDTPQMVLVGGAISAEGGSTDGFGNYILDGGIRSLANASTSVIDAVTITLRGVFSGGPVPVTFNVEDGAAEIDLLVSAQMQNMQTTTGRVIKTGEGTMVISGTNTYSGYTLVRAGTLIIGTNGTTGLPGTAPVTNDARLVFNLSSGIVSNAIRGTGVVVKIGSGPVTLTAASIYFGGTQISNGTLFVNGTIGSGPVEVASGATLGGSGSVAGTVTNAGTVAPGGSIGVLTFNQDYAQTSAGTLALELGGTATAGTDYDQLSIGGAAALDGALTITLTNGYVPAFGDALVVFAASGGITGSFSATNLPALGGGNVWVLENYGSALLLSVTNGAPPPPTGYAGFALQITNTALRGIQDDADGDGYANLLEYVTGANPTNADTLARMNAVRTNGILALRFTRNTNSLDATLIVEGSSSVSNNATWTGFATNIGGSWGGATNVIEGPGSPATVTAYDVVPATNRFLRLRVTLP